MSPMEGSLFWLLWKEIHLLYLWSKINLLIGLFIFSTCLLVLFFVSAFVIMVSHCAVLKVFTL